MPIIEISIIIATYKPDLIVLGKLLSQIKRQGRSIRFEVLVVENGSKYAFEICRLFGSRCRYIHTNKTGLSQARNLGINNSRAKIVSFLDDDVILDKNWLGMLLASFRSLPEQVVCIGGRVDPLWLSEAPSWIDQRLYKYYSITYWSRYRRPTSEDEWLVGANLAFRRMVFRTVGVFKQTLGRKGDLVTSGEEVELQRRIKKHGLVCYFDPTIKVKHIIRPERGTLWWLLKRIFYQGQASVNRRGWTLIPLLGRFFAQDRFYLGLNHQKSLTSSAAWYLSRIVLGAGYIYGLTRRSKGS